MALFQQALPVWERGKQWEKNYFLVFRTPVRAGGRTTVRFTAAVSCMLLVNGELAASGPSRAPHGYCRVDEADITPLLTQQENVLVIVAAGYAINGYAMLERASFVQAEVVQDGRVIAATGTGGFAAYPLAQKLRRVQRYSFQRPFCEQYRLDAAYAPLMRALQYEGAPVELTVCPPLKLLPHGGVYPDYAPLAPVQRVASGHVGYKTPEPYAYYKYISKIGPAIQGFAVDELEDFLAEKCRGFTFEPRWDGGLYREPEALAPDTYTICRFPFNATGHLTLTVSTQAGCSLYLLFDEVLTGADVDFMRLNCTNAVEYRLCPGEHRLITYELYTMQYLKLCAVGGDLTVESIRLRQVKYPGVCAALPDSDPILRMIDSAAVETLCQNAVDLLMDCPHRERAGWLCDSFFTGRAEWALTGKNTVEHAFLENYLLPGRYPDQPEGMVPMCYPSEHRDGRYIPNWAMWLVLELAEYRARTGDEAMIGAYREKVYAIVRCLAGWENRLGLLELPGAWVFVDATRANRMTQDVNFPTNMLYAAMLETVDRLYHDPELAQKAARLKRDVLKRAYDETLGFFVDHAVWQRDALVPVRECTESAQYYAFLFGGATPQSHAALWRRLLTQFGPNRAGGHDPYPQMDEANAFIGVQLRLETLFRFGRHAQMMAEIKDYFAPQAALTGTLWEKRTPTASLNHGFASHIAYLMRAVRTGMR